jgi:hypothetical protein
LFVSNDGPGDSLTLWDYSPEIPTMPSGSIYNADDLVLTFSDPSGNLLQDNGVPTINLDEFPGGTITFDGTFFGTSTSADVAWTGSVAFIQAVPEPSGVLILAFGLTGMVCQRLRRARRNG